MAKVQVYVIDTGKSEITDASAITGYTKVNSGNEFVVAANSVDMTLGKTVNSDVSLGRKDSSGYYKEGSVQHNSVANRTFTINGVIDRKVSGDQTKYQLYCLLVRSPAIFALRCELTEYADDPHGAYNDSTLGTNLTGGKYQFVVFNNLTTSTSADDLNIVNFTLQAVLVND